MIPWWWSALLAVSALASAWIIGNHRWWGWAVAVALQLLWISYGTITRQWGFIASAVLFGGLNIRNMIKWKREQAERAEA